jgi:molecular chaperone HscB
VSSSIPEYFALFGFAPRFAIDLDRLKRAYDEVLALVHPDRHVRAGAGERRAAMQLASHANEAFQVLKNDSSRAAYLCRSHGVIVEGVGAAPLDRSFLEQQMQWREALDEARTVTDGSAVIGRAAQIAAEVKTQRAAVLVRIARLIDETGDYAAAAAEVRALMFLDKLIAECARLGAPAGTLA